MSNSRKSKIEPVHVEEAKRLKALFAERNELSQIAFGAKFEIGTQGMVWQYLNARSALNIEAAVKFARALNCTVEDFSPRLAAMLAGADRLVVREDDEIQIPPVIAPDEQAPGLYAIEQRTVARPPLTQEEYDVLDGYRVASEAVKADIRGKCLIALTDHERREGGRQKKA